MNYQIVIKRQAHKKLKKLKPHDRNRIAEKIMLLGDDPDTKELDVKKLVGEPFYRLRIGDWRIIFDREDVLKIISIEKLKARGDVYK